MGYQHQSVIEICNIILIKYYDGMVTIVVLIYTFMVGNNLFLLTKGNAKFCTNMHNYYDDGESAGSSFIQLKTPMCIFYYNAFISKYNFLLST